MTTTAILSKFLAALIAMATFAAAAEPILFTATVRSHIGAAPDAVAGTLYEVNPATAAAKPIGDLRLAGKPIGITGLAVHPKSGVLYGVTAGSSPNYRSSLVSIDPNTAEASIVGPMRVSGSDITFSPEGELFIWLPDTNQIGRINVATGRVTPLGEIGESTRLEGGIAFDGQGRLYVTAAGATGAIEMRDPASGAATSGPMLNNAPYLSSMNALAFSPSGELFGINSNMGTPARTALVKIDTENGVVTQIGPLPEDTDCLAFVNSPRASLLARQSPANIVLVGSIFAAGLLGMVIWMRRRRTRVTQSAAPADSA